MIKSKSKRKRKPKNTATRKRIKSRHDLTELTKSVSLTLIILEYINLMRTLSSNKSIKSMERKPTRKFKPLPLLNTPHSLSFSDVSELIFKVTLYLT